MGRSSVSPSSSSIDSSKSKLPDLSPSSATTSAAASSTSTSASSSSTSGHSTNRGSKSRSRISLKQSSNSMPTPRDHRNRSDWPPIKPLLRSALAGKTGDVRDIMQPRRSLFVKVYKEGAPIGRKLDLLCHEDYDDLVETLSRMFKTNIHSPNGDRVGSDNYHVLTYEDKDGDWMLVGDVPWEMFITNVRRLKIARADKC